MKSAFTDVTADSGVRFTNVFGTAKKLWIRETTGSGAALLDYDRDGDLDVYLVQGMSWEQAERGAPGPPDRFYRNDGGWRFTDVTEAARLGDTDWGGGVAVGDVDGDGWPDLFVANDGPDRLYRNRGDGSFEDWTARSGLSDLRWNTSAAFGDIDRDGDLDLYVCAYIEFDPDFIRSLDPKFCRWKDLLVMCGPNGLPAIPDRLYRNLGGGRFEDVTQAAGVDQPDGKGLGVIFFDADADGDQDLYVANDSTPNHLFRNDGRGRFEEDALLAGVALSEGGRAQAGMGADSGDLDADGDLDLVVTNFQDDYTTLYRNDGEGHYTDVSELWGLALLTREYLSWGVRLADFDLDGDLDLFQVSGHVYPQVEGTAVGESYRQRAQLLLQQGGRFHELEASGSALAEPRSGRGAAFGDLDGDGDTDIVINVMDGPAVLLRNDLGAAERALLVRLINPQGGDALGARAELQNGERRMVREVQTGGSYLSSNDPRIVFGVDPDRGPLRLKVRWPSGASESFEGLRAGFEVTIQERKGIVKNEALRNDATNPREHEHD